MVWTRSKRIHLHQAGDIIYCPTAMQMPSANSSTTIHIWAQLALTSHMSAGWVNDSQVALTILKLGAHPCPLKLCEGTPTHSLKPATPFQLVKEASQMRGETSSSNWNNIQHLELVLCFCKPHLVVIFLYIATLSFFSFNFQFYVTVKLSLLSVLVWPKMTWI